MSYITSTELRNSIDSQGTLNTNLFDDLVVQVSDAIDKHCYRTFAVPSSETVRYFKPTPDRLEIDDLDDIASTTGLAVAVDSNADGSYSNVLTADTDYVIETNRDGMVTHIRALASFPFTRYRPNSIKVTARFGWPSVPTPVKRAALIWGTRLWNRKDTPSGVVGFADFGAVRLTKIDPDVSELLAPYVDRGRLLR